MLLPDDGSINELLLAFEKQASKTKTYSINIIENIVGGSIDELKALEQHIYLMLNTELDKYIIYPYTYGLKTIDLIGKPLPYVMVVIPERIKETLLTDNRIKDVSDFKFKNDGNKLHVSFVVNTIYGKNLNNEMVVQY